jgi:Ca-activated chloride channel homolog
MRKSNPNPRRASLAARIGALAILMIALSAGLLVAPAHTQSRTTRPTQTSRPFPPPVNGEVRGSTRVSARLDGLILQVDCEQTFVNDGSRLQEVEILIPVPADAVVTNGLLLADGQEYPAEVLPADEARRIYEEIVRSRRDPALIELAGHGLIRLSAFPIPPGGTRQVSFRYSQTLAAHDGRLRLLFPVAALCGLNRTGPLDLSLTIDGRESLAQVYSPSHDLVIEREGSSTATLHYDADHPDPHETLEVIAVRNESEVGVDLRTARGHGEEDYFLLAVSPGWGLLSERKQAPKTVIFVLDRSGSMQGSKFEQARHALQTMIEQTAPDDRFNLICFSSEVRTLFPDGPRRATGEARRRADAWLRGLDATGGTAMADAIDEACRQIDRSGIVLFLTDGLPTVGEQDHDAIVRRSQSRGRSTRFYAFGVGYDVDATLLDDLARRGGGSVSYVRPEENIEEAVNALRQRVEYPCARNVRLQIVGARVHDLLPEGPRDLFAGEPLIFAGRVRSGSGRATVRLTAEGPDGRTISDSWSVDFDDEEARSSAVPVLWASRKAADLIEKIRREGHDPQALEELRELSRRYGILNEEVALLAREDMPLVEVQSSRDRTRGGAAGSANRPQVRLWGGSDRDQLTGMAAPMPLSAEAPAERKKEVELSAKVWSLNDAVSMAAIEKDGVQSDSARTVGEVAFRKVGDTWIDMRIDDRLPVGTEMIRVRSFGAAYFELARADGRFADWFALGERVRVLLPGMVFELTPDGEESLPAETIRRVIEAAEKL